MKDSLQMACDALHSVLQGDNSNWYKPIKRQVKLKEPVRVYKSTYKDCDKVNKDDYNRGLFYARQLMVQGIVIR